MSNPYLEWSDETGQTFRRELVDKVFIGRCCRGIEESRRIVLKDLAVSRDHAIVSLDGSHFQITDMSKNGVWVNDIRVESGSSWALTDSDIIKVGDTCITIKLQCDAEFDEIMEDTLAGPVEMIITSLVADVRGFSGISQRDDSLHVYAFMKQVFETLLPLSMISKEPSKTMPAMLFMPFGTMGLLFLESGLFWPVMPPFANLKSLII